MRRLGRVAEVAVVLAVRKQEVYTDPRRHLLEGVGHAEQQGDSRRTVVCPGHGAPSVGQVGALVSVRSSVPVREIQNPRPIFGLEPGQVIAKAESLSSSRDDSEVLDDHRIGRRAEAREDPAATAVVCGRVGDPGTELHLPPQVAESLRSVELGNTSRYVIAAGRPANYN